MDKRYQVFVSSTYADLKEERAKIIQALMELDCIPSGMEMFPAFDEEQWEFIKRVIDDCDYYLLVIGGRYGSLTSEGISYTEKEYDYAVEKGIKVLAFLHEEPDNIPVGKTDKNHELQIKLEEFRGKVSTGRLVKHWKAPDQLPGLVALSLSKTIKTYPAVGWVRSSSVGSTELLSEINSLRKENDDLNKKISMHTHAFAQEVGGLAEIDSKLTLSGTYELVHGGTKREWKFVTTWANVFATISPYLMEHPSDGMVKIHIKNAAKESTSSNDKFEFSLNDQIFQTIKLQYMALGLVDINYLKTTKGDMAMFWSLTDKGRQFMLKLRTVKAVV